MSGEFSLLPSESRAVELVFFIAHRDENINIEKIAHGKSVSAAEIGI
jgi:hypothetical protein